MLPLRDILSTPSPRNSPPPTSATSASTHAHAHAAQFRHAAEPHLATASNNNNNNYIASQDAQRVQSLLETASSYLEQGHNRPRAALAADQHPSHTHTHGHGNHHHHHGHHHHRLSLSETTTSRSSASTPRISTFHRPLCSSSISSPSASSINSDRINNYHHQPAAGRPLPPPDQRPTLPSAQILLNPSACNSPIGHLSSSSTSSSNGSVSGSSCISTVTSASSHNSPLSSKAPGTDQALLMKRVAERQPDAADGGRRPAKATKRRNRPPYTVEQGDFIRFVRDDLCHTWEMTASLYNQFWHPDGENERHISGLQSRYYRLLDVPVRDRKKLSAGSVGRPELGILAQTSRRYWWMEGMFTDDERREKAVKAAALEAARQSSESLEDDEYDDDGDDDLDDAADGDILTGRSSDEDEGFLDGEDMDLELELAGARHHRGGEWSAAASSSHIEASSVATITSINTNNTITTTDDCFSGSSPRSRQHRARRQLSDAITTKTGRGRSYTHKAYALDNEDDDGLIVGGDDDDEKDDDDAMCRDMSVESCNIDLPPYRLSRSAGARYSAYEPKSAEGDIATHPIYLEEVDEEGWGELRRTHHSSAQSRVRVYRKIRRRGHLEDLSGGGPLSTASSTSPVSSKIVGYTTASTTGAGVGGREREHWETPRRIAQQGAAGVY